MSTSTTFTDHQIVTRNPAVLQSRPNRYGMITVTAPAASALAELERTLTALLRGHDDARLLGSFGSTRDFSIVTGAICLVSIRAIENTTLTLPETVLKYTDNVRPIYLVYPGVTRADAFDLIRRLLSRPAAADPCRALVPISHYRVLQNEYRQTWLKLAVADFLSYAAKRHSSAPRVQVFDLDDTRQGVTYPSFALF